VAGSTITSRPAEAAAEPAAASEPATELPVLLL
jgi:hypothetical protein